MSVTSKIILLLLMKFMQVTYCSVPSYPMNLRFPLEAQNGLGWPHSLHVAVGHDALLKLSKVVINQQSCEIQTPMAESFNINSLPSDRYETWSDGCGVRIKNISKADEGRWRLTSTRGDQTITAFSEVYVIDAASSYDDVPTHLFDGNANSLVELTTLDNMYCVVELPFAQSSLVPGHCKITLDKTSRAVQGTWKVLLGLPGHVSELEADREVTVDTENLDVGYIHDTQNNKLHLHCNIVHGDYDITFCRFQKTSLSSGYNLIDGLSDGHHSYYGEGFPERQCGMTIEHPAVHDFTIWRCSVGVKDKDSTEHRNPKQALISVTAQQSAFSYYLDEEHISSNPLIDDNTVFSQAGAELKMSCQGNAPLSYCWFQHPNGTQYTPGARVLDPSEEQIFWYSGEGLLGGDCSITFADVDEELAGSWICHMGLSLNKGIEITDTLDVRVTGPLAANKQEVLATTHSTTVLHCHSSGVARSLNYCRFVNPNFVGINIDDSITAENAILGRYYFTPNKSIDHGDCSLTISPVLEEDEGIWTCAALIVGQNSESRDYTRLHVTVTVSESTRHTATILGTVFGALLLVLIAVGYLGYRKKSTLINTCRNNTPQRNISMSELAARSSESSAESGYTA